MELSRLLELQRRCANRLYDLEMVELYLAIQKEVNKRAEVSTLDIEPLLMGVEGDLPGLV